MNCGKVFPAQRLRIALAEIIIGSNQNTEETCEQLKRLLADKGYKVVDSIEYPVITVSAIPPWNPTSEHLYCLPGR